MYETKIIDVFYILINDRNFYNAFAELETPIFKAKIIQIIRQYTPINYNNAKKVMDIILSHYEEEFGHKYSKSVLEYLPEIENQKPKKETTMTAPIFETKHLIHGTDIKDMSNNQVFHVISKIESEIEKLKKIKTKSKTIESQIEKYNADIVNIVKILDAKK